MLDFTSLEKAISRLEEGLNRYLQDTNDIQIRDGLIQRFEFTYELSHKMLKRYLVAISPNSVFYDGISFQDLIRTGNEYGLLLGEWLDWKQYREMRSRTSHTYDEDTAIAVVQGIPKFLSEAKYLQEKLKSGQNG